MKFRITLKDPDGVHDSLSDAVEKTLEGVLAAGALNDAEIAKLRTARRERLHAAMGPWVEHGEYVTIEIDTEAGAAVVMRGE